MSATQDLIAAALTAAEVERLVQNLESCAKWASVEVEDENHRRIWLEEQMVTRTALLNAVRAIVAERDQFRDAAKMVSAAPPPVGEVKAVEGIPIPTGHAEADRIIGRLMSSDPDFQDCTDAAALIQREICGPDGFATWREAALAERIKRTPQPVGTLEGLASDLIARQQPLGDEVTRVLSENMSALYEGAQPVSDVPMPEPDIMHTGTDGELYGYWNEYQMIHYGDACKEAGYAAGVAAAGKDADVDCSTCQYASPTRHELCNGCEQTVTVFRNYKRASWAALAEVEVKP